IQPNVLNKKLAKISLANSTLLLDFRLPDDLILRASFEQSAPAFYLDKPRKEPQNDAHPFITTLRKELVGAIVTDIYKSNIDRIVWLEFEKFDESGQKLKQSLLFFFTGRTANAYLLDANHYVEVSLNTRGSNILRVGD